MLKNENGCPCMNLSSQIRENAESSINGGRAGAEQGGDCGGRGDCIDAMPLAYVYAPNQKFCMLYSASDALAHGTLFEQLYKPMEVYGNE